MARRLISLPEAAGPPESCKVLGGAARRRKRCSQLVRMMQNRLPASNSAQVYRCFVPVQGDAAKAQGELAAVSRGAATARREPSRGRDRGLRGRSRDILVRTA